MVLPAAPEKKSRAKSTKRSAPAENQNQEEPTTKRFKPDYASTITVLAGSVEKAFTVHEDPICHKSPFFKAACSHDWKEGQEKLVKLPTIEPIVFEAYIHWVYTHDYFVPLGSHQAASGCVHKHGVGCSLEDCLGRDQTFLYCKLYAAAVFLLDDALQIKVTDLLNDQFQRRIFLGTTEAFVYVWAETREGCGLQRLLIDGIALMVQSASIKVFRNLTDSAFAWDVFHRMVELRGKPIEDFTPGSKHRCYYHDHPEGEICL